MSNKTITNAITALLALGLTTPVIAEDMASAPAPHGLERCYGVAKSGQNNCGNNMHGCGGEARVDFDKSEWMFVPAGRCKKIGGLLKPGKEVKS